MIRYPRRSTTTHIAMTVLILGAVFVVGVAAVAFTNSFDAIGLSVTALGSSSDSGERTAFASRVTLITLAGTVLYLAPTIIAAKRRHPNAGPISIVNLLLGWTFLGFVAALVWSLTAFTEPDRI